MRLPLFHAARGHPRRRVPHGLTLVELMIVLALVGILAAVAVPAYQGWQDRVNSFQAATDIAAMGARLENRWQDTREYPASLDEVYPNAVDPWGRPYQYLRLVDLKGNGQARKDHSLVPINSNFDLYSMGPDGKSVGPLTAKSSRDDIIWGRDGRFVGKAEDF